MVCMKDNLKFLLVVLFKLFIETYFRLEIVRILHQLSPEQYFYLKLLFPIYLHSIKKVLLTFCQLFAIPKSTVMNKMYILITIFVDCDTATWDHSALDISTNYSYTVWFEIMYIGKAMKNNRFWDVHNFYCITRGSQSRKSIKLKIIGK